LFGHPVSTSASPSFHTFVFRELGLPWSFSLIDSTDLDDLRVALNNPLCAGAAVTLPYKSRVMPMMDQLTEAAMLLGSVNTVYTAQEAGSRIIVGTNTDWTGMMLAIDQVSPGLRSQSVEAAVVVGGGVLGRTAIYSLVRGLGITRIYLVGVDEEERKDALQTIAATDIDLQLELVTSAEQVEKLQQVAPVLFQASRQLDWAEEKGQKSLRLAEAFLHNCSTKGHTGVALDMSYMPPVHTELTKLAEEANWKVASFIDFLAFTATQQFSLWTGVTVEQVP
ncbi:Aminoacid dehydrogenase-like protein, partial [Thozetella sp. PMI_491]